MKILNLYAGIGGNRTHWKNCEVTAVESDPKIASVYRKLHPSDEVVVGDAHQYLLENHSDFDFIWSSPPCQTHSRMAKFTGRHLIRYPDFKLYEEIVLLQHFFDGMWVVENVKPFYRSMIEPRSIVGRHWFWSNFDINASEVKQPSGFINMYTLEARKKMQDWLGIHFEEVLYYQGNHCPVQVLRNCVHPRLGLEVFESFKNFKLQQGLFET